MVPVYTYDFLTARIRADLFVCCNVTVARGYGTDY